MMPSGNEPQSFSEPPRTFYSRSQLLWFGLLLNHLTSVWMLASNFRRMGRPDLQRHTLGIGLLWAFACILFILAVMKRSGFQDAQLAWVGLNLVSVLIAAGVWEGTQSVWVEAAKAEGHLRMRNWMALIHAALVSVAFLLLTSVFLTLLLAFGVPVPMPDIPPPVR